MQQLEKALTLYLGNLDQAIISAYSFGLILLRFYSKKSYLGKPVNIQKDIPSMLEFNRYLDRLKGAGILSQVKGLHDDKFFAFLGKSNVSAGEIICAVDPFAYISHLSAMEYHGLSDRLPKVLFISTLPKSLWGQKAKEKMRKDSEEFIDFPYNELALPRLTKFAGEKIKGLSINRYQSKKIGSFISAEDRRLRVSSIGRTFLDMLREPSLCGGIRHVLDVYEDNAKGLKKLIISEVDRHGTAIEKARAGYILEECCSIKDSVIDEWSEHVTRGGSRKLDPHEAFSSEFSERWCISINC